MAGLSCAGFCDALWLFQFFSDARESETYLRNLQDSIKRKYSCDHNTSLTRLEDLLQDSMVGFYSGPRCPGWAAPALLHCSSAARGPEPCCAGPWGAGCA